MKERWLWAAALLVLMVASAPAARAQAPQAPIDDQTREIVQRMCDYLGSLQSFSVHAEVTEEQVFPTGIKVQLETGADLQVQRPDHLRVVLDGDQLQRTIVYDGKTLSGILTAANQYFTRPAPNTLDAALNTAADETGLTIPLMDFVYSKPCDALLQGVRLGRYLCESKILGVKCHHLVFKQQDVDWQLWVEDSATPVPRKFVIVYKNEPAQPAYMALMTEWKPQQQFAADTFQLVPPEGAQRIECASCAGGEAQ